MKNKILNFIILVSLIAAFSSCRSEDQKLINKLDGTWEFVDIILTEPTTDTFTLPQSGTITFEKCKIRKDNVQTCDGSHQFGAQSKSFRYQPGGSVGGELKAINILYTGAEGHRFYLDNTYEILNMDKENITLKGNIHVSDNDDPAEGRKSYEATFTLKKD